MKSVFNHLLALLCLADVLVSLASLGHALKVLLLTHVTYMLLISLL
jgi:hypothetical protein